MRLTVPAAVLIVAASCGGGVGVGPLVLDVPDGWQLTRSHPDSIQLADGTTASDEDSEPGTAKAVFDVYLDTPHTVSSYREMLEDNDADATEDHIEIGGRPAVRFEYVGTAFGGRQIAVLVPEHEILIVYRAAFTWDRRAFDAGLDGFEEALHSIRFLSPGDAGA